MKSLSTFEKCVTIRDSLLTRVGELMCYHWSNDFKVKSILEIKEDLSNLENTCGSFKINPQDLSFEEMDKLGFSKWDDNSTMKLIPIWLYPFLCDEFTCTSISGKVYNKLSDLDTDHRFGMLAYGVVPK